MMLNWSMGPMAANLGCKPRWVSAVAAGDITISHKSLQNVMLTKNATTTPITAFKMRDRSSSRCSMKDMRSMPSSSPSFSSSSVGGGGGGGGACRCANGIGVGATVVVNDFD